MRPYPSWRAPWTPAGREVNSAVHLERLSDLLQRARAGDSAALEELLAQYEALIAKLSRGPDEEDLAQELRIAFIEMVRRWRPPDRSD